MSQDRLHRIQKARFVRAFFCLFCVFLLSSCHSLQSRWNKADEIILSSYMERETIETPFFPLFSARKSVQGSTPSLTIVIEGDGYSWISRNVLSDNPTPKDPVGLRIAAALDRPVIYLARPCQYILSSKCHPGLWAGERFHKDVLNAYMAALDQIKRTHRTRQFELIGFSGGAYIALALAAKRRDIGKVSTVAGLLDPVEWTNYHDVTPLLMDHDINQLLQSSKNTKFEHICGAEDEVVPCTLTESFIERTNVLKLNNHSVITIPETGHEDLWEESPLGFKEHQRRTELEKHSGMNCAQSTPGFLCSMFSIIPK